MSLLTMIGQCFDALLGWPLIIYVVGISIVCTLATSWIQFRYFFASWRYTLFPEKKAQVVDAASVDMTPFQAFLNVLSANLGNGSIAGMGVAMATGGPGAAFWVVVIGFAMMAVRFAEVFLSIHYGALNKDATGIGGPMLYLKFVPLGSVLTYAYALLCVPFGFVVGNAMQTNSIRESLYSTWGVSPWVSALVLFAFTTYIMCGGSQRIAKATETIVPVKVGVFFVSALILLAYHVTAIPAALLLILRSAFQPVALAGGAIGFSVQQAIRVGMLRSITATEAGLGTAAVLFGSTGSQESVKDSIISMLSTFISTVVCFLIALCIVASGVWSTGAVGAALTVAAFETVFGSFGGWVVSFLSISFGVGVLVTFGYITREAWLYITGGRYSIAYTMSYCAIACAGALVKVDLIWNAVNYINGFMLAVNLFGVMWLLPVIIKHVKEFGAQRD